MTASIYTWENILVKADSCDCEMQMLLLKAYTEDVLGIPALYAPYTDDSDVFDLIVELWGFIRQYGDHPSITDCKYLSFIRYIIEIPLEDIPVLGDAVLKFNDYEGKYLWGKIKSFRTLDI